MTTALITHTDCLNHVTPTGHPERVERLEAINDTLRAATFDALDRHEAPKAEDAHIALAHPQRYIDRIRAASPATGTAMLDGDTHMSPGTLDAALRAAGGNVMAVDMVMNGTAQNAFVACRPPGHHAETETAMGFCLFGNVVIAARHAIKAHGLSRVAIVDFDVHHGNGTQDLVWSDKNIHFSSSQQMPLYPGSGAGHERGAHDTIVNMPLAPGSGGRAFRDVWEREAFPAIDTFKPELLLISAGFDAHARDPLANLELVEEDFAWITGALCDLADTHCDGRVVSTLEGGYDLEGLANSVAAHVSVLMERGA